LLIRGPNAGSSSAERRPVTRINTVRIAFWKAAVWAASDRSETAAVAWYISVRVSEKAASPKQSPATHTHKMAVARKYRSEKRRKYCAMVL
jgi:hypothetical protein